MFSGACLFSYMTEKKVYSSCIIPGSNHLNVLRADSLYITVFWNTHNNLYDTNNTQWLVWVHYLGLNFLQSSPFDFGLCVPFPLWCYCALFGVTFKHFPLIWGSRVAHFPGRHWFPSWERYFLYSSALCFKIYLKLTDLYKFKKHTSYSRHFKIEHYKYLHGRSPICYFV